MLKPLMAGRLLLSIPQRILPELNRFSRAAILLLLCLSSAFYPLSCSNLPVQQETVLYPEPSEMLRIEATAASHPDADIVCLLDEVVNEVSERGESLKTARRVFKILTEAGRSYANCELGFNSRTDSLSLVYARTIKPDGSIIPLKGDAIKIESPNLGESEYSDHKEMSFSMPGVGIGSIVDFKYVKKSKPVISGQFNARFSFQSFHPVILARYKIVAPKAMEIAFFLRNPVENMQQAPVISESDTQKSYLWEYTNIPAIEYEDDIPPLTDMALKLYATTMTSWDDFCGWWWSQAKEQIQTDSAIKDKVTEVTKNLTDKTEKTVALFEYVKKDIRYVTISLGKSGLIPKSASEVYENKYGDCKDKSTLLIAMLREAGIMAHHVLIPTRSRGNLVEEFPFPFQFDHCIVAVESDDGLHFVDATSKNCRYDCLPTSDQDRSVIVIREGKPVFCKTPLADPRANGSFSQNRILINPGGSAVITLRKEFLGLQDTLARSLFIETTQSDIRKTFEEMGYEKFKASRLIDYSYSDPMDHSRSFNTVLEFHVDQYYGKAGDMIILPNFSDCGDCPATGPIKRLHPIVSGARSLKRNEVKISVPAGFEIYSLPEGVEMNNPYFEYRSNYQKNGDEIFHFNEYVNKVTRIPAEDYGAYREQCRMMKDTLSNRVLLRKQR